MYFYCQSDLPMAGWGNEEFYAQSIYLYCFCSFSLMKRTKNQDLTSFNVPSTFKMASKMNSITSFVSKLKQHFTTLILCVSSTKRR